MKRIVIVGGGVTGLAAAYTLVEQTGTDKDIDIMLLEKGPQTGGQIITEKIDGFTIEGGPDCFLGEKPYVYEFAKKLNIEDRLINTQEQNKGTFILKDGKLEILPEGVFLMIPTKIMPFAKTRLLSWPGKLRAGMDLFIPRRREKGDESLGSFVRRRLGQEVLDRIAEPLVGGVHASDPEVMSLMAAFPRFLKMEKDKRSMILAMLSQKRKMAKRVKGKEKSDDRQKRTLFVSFKDGMQELVDALTDAIGSDVIHLNTSVVEVTKMSGKGSGTPYRLVLSDGSTIEADAVILTSLAYATADLVENFDDKLSGILRQISCVSSATISLAYRRQDIENELKGFGFLVPKIENRQIMASTWSSSKWPDRAPDDYILLRVFAGGAFNQNLAFQEDKRLVKIIKSEIKEILGISAEPVIAKVYHWKKKMPQYTLGHCDRVEQIEELTARHEGLKIAGASYQGVGVPDCLNKGRLAAQSAIEHLKSVE